MLCYPLWILTLECPFAELVAEISRHFHVLVSFQLNSVTNRILLGRSVIHIL
jgi:hypothetical protein